MAQDINMIVITGRLGQDPEVNYTPSGIAVCNLNVACTAPQGQESREAGNDPETDWFRVVVWRGQAEACGNFLKKGDQVMVTGRMRIKEYTDADGVKKKSPEIDSDFVKFPPNSSGSQDGGQQRPQGQNGNGGGYQNGGQRGGGQGGGQQGNRNNGGGQRPPQGQQGGGYQNGGQRGGQNQGYQNNNQSRPPAQQPAGQRAGFRD